MKEKLFAYIDEHQQEIMELGDVLFHNPELGFHEFKTGIIIREFLNKHGLKIDRECAYTGFTVSIG
ncbi:MAG: hypothetical protein IJI05_05070, partial [Erysipelotrichaceae bacterium]|nr:hypothetical protein [Erysipelotrichaceae bacterium]